MALKLYGVKSIVIIFVFVLYGKVIIFVFVLYGKVIMFVFVFYCIV